MNVVLRGLRVIDPTSSLDIEGQDIWLDQGRLVGIYPRIDQIGVPVINLKAPRGKPSLIVCPGFIDLHAHLREPGARGTETIVSGAKAAAAGGFTHVVAMANTTPPIDTPEKVAQAVERANSAVVTVLSTAAVTKNLEGKELVNIEKCAAAGASAFTDDGRNAASQVLLIKALEQAAQVSLPVMVHPEDEKMILAGAGDRSGQVVTKLPERPAVAEVSAIDKAISALGKAAHGNLHLQHVSTAHGIELIRQAKDLGMRVTAEVTPHHLSMWLPFAKEPSPISFRKVNPPLRTQEDREALIQAVREGVVDAVATDHAPHRASEKMADYNSAAPGLIGLETALSVSLTLGGLGDAWLPVLIERLTIGPWKILGSASGVSAPRLRIGEPANLVVFDPGAKWKLESAKMVSCSTNTPLLGTELKGKVLLTLANGEIAYRETKRFSFLDSVESKQK